MLMLAMAFNQRHTPVEYRDLSRVITAFKIKPFLVQEVSMKTIWIIPRGTFNLLSKGFMFRKLSHLLEHVENAEQTKKLK